jgi:hypothetical protein
MQQPDYHTVFHIGLLSFPWFFMLPFGVMIAIGCVLARFHGGQQLRQVVGWVFISFSLLFIIILNLSLIPDFFSARHAYLSGNSSVIEGTVEDFHPMPTLGAANESFSVNGTKFSYNVLDSTPCFHNLPPHKGPIHSGLEVRIYYKDSCIQRVDVRQ